MIKGHALGESDHRALRGGVASMIGLPDETDQTGCVQNRAATELEGRQGCARGPEDAFQIHGKQLIPFRFRSCVKWLRGRRNASVVVNRVDPLKAPQCRSHCVLY
jgi:hypothetical protein